MNDFGSIVQVLAVTSQVGFVMFWGRIRIIHHDNNLRPANNLL